MPTTTNHSFDLPTVGSDRNTWGTSLNANWTSLDGKLVDRSGWVGTVSEASGVPTGGIIERGSGVNGEYTRFADGTQICWWNDFSMSVTGGVNPNELWTYPAAFVNGVVTITPTLPFLSTSWSDASVRGKVSTVQSVGISSTQGRVAAYLTESVTVTISDIRVVAIGRWF